MCLNCPNKVNGVIHLLSTNLFFSQISYDPALFRHQNNFLLKIFFLLANLRKQSPRCVPRTATSLFSKLPAQCAVKVSARRNLSAVNLNFYSLGVNGVATWSPSVEKFVSFLLQHFSFLHSSPVIPTQISV